jgi:HEAT repeat protein
MRKLAFNLTLLATFLTASAFAQEAPRDLRPRALPLYEQCAALTSSPARTRSVSAALERLKSDDAPSRIAAATELGESCDRRASEGLVKALRDKDPLVRAASVRALGKLGDRETVEPLQEAIADSDSRVTGELGKTLCSFQAYKPGYAALNFLANPHYRPIVNEGDAYARCQAILYIFQLRDVGFSRKGMLFLFGLSVSENPAIQKIAIEAIRESTKTKNGPHELTGILKQANNPDFRSKAAYWIGELRVEAGRDLLLEVAQSDNVVAVRAEAASALKKLGAKE